MSTVARGTGRWLVSALAHGEVLTTRSSALGLELVLLGLPEGYTPAEIQGWLDGLARSVTGGAHEGASGDPVPPVLREALGGLLFSHGELWGRGEQPCSVALVEGPERIAFGWVGEAVVEVSHDGARTESEWISVRDARGRDARAWCGSAARGVRVELGWSPRPGADAVRMEVRWVTPRDQKAPEPRTEVERPSPMPDRDPAATSLPGLAEPSPGLHEGERREVIEALRAEQAFGVADALAPAPEAEPAGPWAEPPAQEFGVESPVTQTGMEPDESRAEIGPSAPEAEVAPASAVIHHAGEPPSSGIARWLARHVTRTRASEPTSSEVEARSELESLPAAEVEEITHEPSASHEPETSPGTEAAPEAETSVPDDLEVMPPEVPDLIPPTPEPEELTAEAVSPVPEPLAAARFESDPPEIEATSPEPAPASRAVAARHPDWPAEARPEGAKRPLAWRVPALWGGLVAALFGVGWLLGSLQGSDGPAEARRPTPLVVFLRQIGLAPPRFAVAVKSQPEGAWITVDGKDLSLQAPATLELAPGEHRVDLSFPDLGSVGYRVTGAKNDQVTLEAPMWGSVDVVATERSALVSVAMDGEPVGFVPVRLDTVAPGAHELRFSGPGMASWGSTIEVRVGETREVLAYPLQSPATGLLQVRATVAADGESRDLDGARVWVDGEPRGVTPLTLELPRGPHSIRVVHQREELPIQVIDLPGGNQRFASFDFGMGLQAPRLALKAPATFTDLEPGLVSATLGDVPSSEVREMWLHVRAPANRWRRYPMTLMDAQGNMVGAAPFPVALLGSEGRTQYYVSAQTRQGDEYFTEIQTARAAR